MSDEVVSEITRRSVADRLFRAALKHHRQKELSEAEALYRESLALDTDRFDTLCLFGTLLTEMQRLPEAIEILRGAVGLDTENAVGHNNLGIALKADGKFDEALASFDRALALDPRLAKLHFNRGNTLMEIRRFDEALASFDRATAIAPEHAETHNNRGSALRELEQFDAAIEAYGKAIALKPGYADAFNNRAVALAQQGLLEDALADSDRAVALKPAFAEAFVTRGNTLRDLARFDDALSSFEAATALRPGWAEPLFAKGTLLLSRGQFAEGWRLYEWRWKLLHAVKPTSPKPLWDGRADLGGKHILVYCEQGIGDTFQFIRYLRSLRRLGATVSLSTYDTLVKFLSQLEPDIRIVSNKIRPETIDHDYQCPLLSLPMVLETTLATIPGEVPYLRADPERTRLWRERLGGTGFKVGICWDGRSDKGRSFPLSLFKEIARIPRVRLISLHKGSGETQLAALQGAMEVEILGEDFDPPGESFLDTAAAMKNCDLVITCDTSIAHLAGALAVPVWLVLKESPEWRWLQDRSDSPWYPTMRLYRQKSRGDWVAPFKEMEAALRRMSSKP